METWFSLLCNCPYQFYPTFLSKSTFLSSVFQSSWILFQRPFTSSNPISSSLENLFHLSEFSLNPSFHKITMKPFNKTKITKRFYLRSLLTLSNSRLQRIVLIFFTACVFLLVFIHVNDLKFCSFLTMWCTEDRCAFNSPAIALSEVWVLGLSSRDKIRSFSVSTLLELLWFAVVHCRPLCERRQFFKFSVNPFAVQRFQF